MEQTVEVGRGDLLNMIRELEKVADVLEVASRHFNHEAEMNAALHMATTVRPAPLGQEVSNTLFTLDGVLNTLKSKRDSL